MIFPTEQQEKEYIDDNIRKGIDSAIQAVTILIGNMQTEQRIHQENEKIAIEQLKNDLVLAVENQIKKTVNGKIDRIQQNFDENMKEIAPLIKDFKDAKITEEVLAKKGKKVVKWAGTLATLGGGAYAIKQFFIWFLK